MENLHIIGLVIIASVVCILLLIYILFVSKKAEQELDLLRRELAGRLGLIYERAPEKQVHSSRGGPAKGTEMVNWRIGGMIKDREVRLENRSHRSRGMGPHSHMTMTMLLVSCRTPRDLGFVVVILGAGEALESNDEKDFYYPHPRDRNKQIGVKVKGPYNQDFIPSTDMIGVMTQSEIMARLDVEKGWMTLFYEFGDGQRNVDPIFVKRAMNAAIELARKVEKLW
ncbi:MAG: hypothetical protein JRI43_02840 [Deltaproteobacteria bacterium]|nr:hypothetical protein [Deltaproteobacteria bacterium]